MGWDEGCLRVVGFHRGDVIASNMPFFSMTVSL